MNSNLKKFTTFSALLPAVVLAAGSVSAAGPAQWASPGNNDIRIDSLPAEVPAAPASRHVESQPVQYAWPLSIDRSEAPASGPTMESRQYWVDTTGRGLESGLKLPLSSPGAIVRVSALHADSGLLLDAGRLEVSVDGRDLPVMQGNNGGLELVTGAQLQSQGMPVPDDSLAFQLPESGQPRSLGLQMAGAPADQALVVHVFEPQSPWRGKLSAGRHTYLAGSSVNLDVGLMNGEERFAPQSVQAVLVSPDAKQSWPLDVTDDGLGLQGMAPQDLPDAGDGLYEVHAYMESRQGDATVRRDLKVAVNIAQATARLTDGIRTRGDRGLTVDLGVEVAEAGRYQVSGQVWGTAANGSLEPLAMAQTAAVLQPGKGQLQLDVPADMVAESGLSAPFSVREVQLFDQGRMALLESRAHGFTVAPDTGAPRSPFDTIDH